MVFSDYMKKHFLPFIVIILLVIAAVALGVVRENMADDIFPDTEDIAADQLDDAQDEIIEEEEPTDSESTTPIDQALTGKTWMWTRTSSEGGPEDFTVPAQEGAFTITFEADGSVYGTTDCNNFFGTYEAQANTISFGPLGSTLMFCEGAQESQFLSQLQDVEFYELFPEVLSLSSEAISMQFK